MQTIIYMAFKNEWVCKKVLIKLNKCLFLGKSNKILEISKN